MDFFEWARGAWAYVISPAAIAATLGWAIKLQSAQRNERRQRRVQFQPLINRLTVRLEELARTIEHFWQKQWEMSVTEYGVLLPPDRLDELAEEAAAISLEAGKASRELTRQLAGFVSDLERQDEISRQRAAEILSREGRNFVVAHDETDPEVSFLIENQRYHLWAEHLYAAEQAVADVAESLVPHAESDAKRALANLSSDGRVERIGRQAGDTIEARRGRADGASDRH
jgi:hypothetical protein